MTPAEIVSLALYDAGPGTCDAAAAVALTALTDDRIIDHAMAAVRSHRWTAPDVEDLTDRELRIVLRVAFGSLKEN